MPSSGGPPSTLSAACALVDPASSLTAWLTVDADPFSENDLCANASLLISLVAKKPCMGEDVVGRVVAGEEDLGRPEVSVWKALKMVEAEDFLVGVRGGGASSPGDGDINGNVYRMWQSYLAGQD